MNSQLTPPLVAVAMSGGVDSSVAAALLLEQGFDVIGVTMRLPEPQDLRPGGAPASVNETPPAYIDDARKVAEQLNIPHTVVDLREAFQQQVIAYFCEEYTNGRTPNPCVFCNPQIKFGLLFDHAQALGAQRLATGHYVRRGYDEQTKRYLLRAAANRAKDQSYFLYRLTQQQLARSLFPLSSLTKEDIREKARALRLERVAEKAESQENCFISGQTYQQFLEEYLPPESRVPGPIVDMQGQVVGQHQGIQLYTIGQRRGLGVAMGSPRYVVAIHPDTNTVVIGENHDLLTQEFCVRHLNFIAQPSLPAPRKLHVKIRYRHAATPATVMPGEIPQEVRVRLEIPQRAVTPGQSAVFYAEDLVIGGGVIERRLS